MGDNDKIKLGASGDLEIYHDASNSYVDDTGTGRLFLRGNDRVQIQKYTGEDMITCKSDGAVELFHDNAKKFETTSSGATITGSLLTTNIYGANDANTGIQFEGSDVLTFHSGGVENIQLTSNAIVFNQDSADMDFRVESNNNSAMFFIDGANDGIGIGTDSPTVALQVEGAGNQFIFVKNSSSNDGLYLKAGTGASSLQTGGGSHIMNFFTNGNERMRIGSGGQVSIGTTSTSGSDRVTIKGSTADSTTTFLIKNSSDTTLFDVRNDGRCKIQNAYSETTGNSANLFVDTDGRLIRATSSERYKNTIKDATHGLTEVLKLRSVTYKGNNDGDTVFGGLIAEEVHDAGLTEFVQYNEDNQPDALAYGNMVSLCIKAIQELKAENTALANRITALEGA
jgi:hypothetical protein